MAAMSRQMLMESIQQTEREIECLAEISMALNRSFNLTELLNGICNRVCGVLQYRACSIMLHDPKSSVLAIQGYSGMDPDYVIQVNTSRVIRLSDSAMSSGPSGQAFLKGDPIAIKNIYEHEFFRPWVSANPGFSSMISLPMGFRGTRIGVLNCYTEVPREFTDREQQLLRTIASQAAVAIGIVQFVEGQQEQIRQQQSLTDQMKEQRDRLLQLRQIHDRLSTIVLTGGNTEGICQVLSDLIQNPVGVVSQDGRLLAASKPLGVPLPEGCNPERAASLWLLPDQPYPGLDLRPYRLPPQPGDGLECGRVMAPILAGEERLGYVVALEALGSLGDLEMAALEHGCTAIALDLVHAQALSEAEQRLRGDFLDEVLRGQYQSEEYLKKRFVQLGYKPEGDHQVILVQVEGAQESDLGDRADISRSRLLSLITQVTSSRNPEALVTYRNGLFTVVWPLNSREVRGRGRSAKPSASVPGEVVARAIQEALVAAVPGRRINIGIGRPYAKLLEMPKSLDEAMCALKVLQRLSRTGGLLGFNDMGIYRVLLQSGSSRPLLDFSQDTLETIRRHDSQWNSGLEQTLRTYLGCHLNTQKTAEALFVHPNTIMYRLRKLERLCSVDLRNPQHLLHYQLALMIDEIAR